MTFTDRVGSERVALATSDPGGEREAVSPVVGSPGYWDNEIERPLRGSAMDRDIAERIATALEQISLELAESNDQNGRLEPIIRAAPTTTTAPMPTNVTFTAPHAQWVGNAQLGVPQYAPPQCPVHGKTWRGGKYGAFCASRMPDGTWCSQKPQVVPAGTALP